MAVPTPCSHIATAWPPTKLRVRLAAAAQDLGYGKSLKCITCHEGPDDVWLCVHCCLMFCGRSTRKHALKHCTETKTHAVVLHMKTRMLWCYMCDMEVLDEPSLLRRESGDENETDNTSQPVYDVTKTHAPCALELRCVVEALLPPTGLNGTIKRTAPSQHDTARDSDEDTTESDDEGKHAETQTMRGVRRSDSSNGVVRGNRDAVRSPALTPTQTTIQFPAVTIETVGDNEEGRGLCGLNNQGNTCFLNSVIQALSNVPLFARLMSDLIFPVPLPSGSLPLEFSSTLTDMWSGRYNSVRPTGVFRCLRRINPMFDGYEQHDAQEALRFLVNELHEKLSVHVWSKDSVGQAVGRSVTHSTLSTSSAYVPPPVTLTSSSNVTTSSPTSTTISSTTTSSISVSSVDTTVNVDGVVIASASNITDTTTITSTITSPIAPTIPLPHILTTPLRTSSSRYRPPQWLTRGPYTGPARHQQSIISDVFRGVCCSSVTCSSCGQVSTTQEYFYDLSLPIPKKRCADSTSVVTVAEDGRITPVDGDVDSRGLMSKMFCKLFGASGGPVRLSDCIQAFCAPEQLSGGNKYDCSQCKTTRNAVKSIVISQPPEVLCMHLKRFSYHNVWGSKISTHVEFPLQGFDLSSWMHRPGGAVIYDLTSVVVHMGGMTGGHYISYGKNRLNQQWYEFDDARVTRVEEGDVSAVQGYILFYTRRRLHVPALPPLTRPHPTPSPSTCYISAHWLLKASMAVTPGPCGAGILTCDHGNVKQHILRGIHHLVVPVTPTEFTQLSQLYGAGTVLTSLTACDHCVDENDALTDRRTHERDTITKMNASVTDGGHWYIISESWLRRWRNFIDNTGPQDGTGRGVLPPGPIDNGVLLKCSSDHINTLDVDTRLNTITIDNPLLTTTPMLMSTQSTSTTSNSSSSVNVTVSSGGAGGTSSSSSSSQRDPSQPVAGLKPIKHYRGLNAAVWNMLHDIYGGGPVIRRAALDIYSPPV